MLGSLVLAACSSSPEAPTTDEDTTGEHTTEDGFSDPETGMTEGGPDTATETATQQDLAQQQEHQKILARDAYKAAQLLFEQGSTQEAYREIQRALKGDPNNPEYIQLNRRIATAMGNFSPTKDQLTQDAAKQAKIREDRIRAQAGIYLQNARKAMEVGDFTGARSHALKVQNLIKYAPIGRWEDIQSEADSILAMANELRQQQLAQKEAELKADVTKALKDWQEEMDQRQKNEIEALLTASTDAFNQEKYNESMQLADRVLKVEPENERAMHLSLSSRKLKLDKSQKDYRKAKADLFKEWRIENERLKITYTDVLTMPSAAKFVENQERRRVAYADESPAAEAAKVEMTRQLKSSMVPGGPAPEDGEPKLKIESLNDLIELVRNNPPIVDGSPVRVLSTFSTDGDDFGDEGPEIMLEFYHDISLMDVMQLTMDQANVGAEEGGTRYAFQLHPDRIQFVKIGGEDEGAVTDAVLRTYKVKDLTFRLNNFIGPDIGKIRLPGSMDESEGAGPYGTVDVDNSLPLIAGDKLEDLITSTIEPSSWNEPYSITRSGDDESPTAIMVNHRPEVQYQIAEFLANLKRTTTSLVTIESKFLTISENFLQEVGVDFRGLGGTSGTLVNLDDVTNGLEDAASLGLDNNGEGIDTNAGQHPSSGIFFDDGSDGDLRARTEHIFDNELGSTLTNTGGATVAITVLDDTELSIIFRAIEKFADFRIVNSQTLSVFNTQRSYITVINQIAYIQDFDVEVAQASFIADPVVNILQDGVVLDVRPVITQDRKHIILELRPTVANLKRPIPLFSTSLAGLTIPVQFHLPELQVSQAQTTAVVPDGASILIGGLKTIRNIERRAEVPLIADIPIVGFLGRREGISDETESLMVLIRAYITDVEEELQRYLADN